MEILKLSIPNHVKVQIPEIIKTGINTPLRLAHFLGQTAHESQNFNAVRENLNYSVRGLVATFKKYFDLNKAVLYGRKPEKIANLVYANRMGNGNEASGDGWKYRGRGYIQLTGKNNYMEFDKQVPENIIENPDLVATQYPLLSAAWFWNKNNLNNLADKPETKDFDPVLAITKKINGGTTGIEDRRFLINKFKKELGIN